MTMTRQTKRNVIALLIFTSLLGVAKHLDAQGTAFTYQGRLQSETTSANGSYDFTFSIWTNPSGPLQVGSTVTNIATGVTNGLFTVMMDFGGVFDGNPRWLEIGVRTNGNGTFTSLSPRQLLTATPYAIYASRVSATGINGTIPAANIGNGTVTSNMLAAGAAAANLAANGQSAVPSGAMLLSTDPNSTNLIATGYMKIGGYVDVRNLWLERAASPSLAARAGHTAIWTGNKMIVWGGYCGSPIHTYYNDGGCYDPLSDGWSGLATNGAPAGRESFTTVWTGNEMIIWGGYFYDTSWHVFNDGARYNPTSNSWSAVTTNGAPNARYGHTAVWTGTEMIVWGGMNVDGGLNYFNDGWRYNPASNTWSMVTMAGAPTPRRFHTAVWTGSEMIIWGGLNENTPNTYLSDGGRYNPATDTWSPMTNNAPYPRCFHTAVWTGSEMIVWGGYNFSPVGTGGRYNPANDSWSAMDDSFAPAPRSEHTAVWTGTEMMIWGGRGSALFNDGGSYNPATNVWTPITTSPRAPGARNYHSAVWTGSEMIIWDGGGCYNDTWSCTPPKLLYLYLK